MDTMTPALPDTASSEPPPFRALPQLAVVETDRFCAGCGYNLRQQPVRREPVTKLLLVQCPECGAFDPVTRDTSVSRLWFAWLVRLLLVLWVAAVLLIAWIAGAIQYVLMHEFAMLGVVLRWENGQMLVSPRHYETPDRFVAALMLGSALLVGWATVMLMTVLLPHWRKVGYAAVLLGVLSLAGLTVGLDLHWMLERYAAVAYWPRILSHLLLAAGACLLGGLIALWLARPLVRLLVRIVVPPKMRPPLAYLWLADGKTPPITRPQPGT